MKNDEHDVEDMGQIQRRFRLIERIYITILVLLYALIICTPHLIASALLKNNILIGAEFIEGFLITVLLVISYFVSARYRKDLDSYHSHIDESCSFPRADVEKAERCLQIHWRGEYQVEEIQTLSRHSRNIQKIRKILKTVLVTWRKRFCL